MSKLDPVDKKIVFGKADVNLIEPLKHMFAWDAFNTGNANHWLPQEISMTADIANWNSDKFTLAERVVIKRSMGFFSTADSVVVNNLVLAVYGHLTSPECRLYLLRQAYEEAIHTLSYQYIIESLNLDQAETYKMYTEVPSVRDKALWAQEYSDRLTDPGFKVRDEMTLRLFLESLAAFYLCFEGVFFTAGFAQLFALGRRGLLPGTNEQLQYILRDEMTHYAFGTNLINEVKRENPGIWDAEMQAKVTAIVKEATILECSYCRDTMPKGFLGLSASDYETYVHYVANERLRGVGLGETHVTASPLEWMDEMFYIKKEKNFFESRVTEYQVGGALEWD